MTENRAKQKQKPCFSIIIPLRKIIFNAKLHGENIFLQNRDNRLGICYNGKNESPGGIPMFKNLFNPENGLMMAMTQITDVIFLSLFWMLCCFPVVTIGPATAALYAACYHGFRKGDKHPWQRFGSALKGNLKVGIPATLVFLALFLAGGWVLIQLWNGAVCGNVSWMLFAAGAFLGVVLLGMLSLMFPLLSRFETGTVQLLKNTLLLGFVNLPRTILLGMFTAAELWLCARYIFPLFFLPALSALIATLFVEPMLKPYMTTAENAAG